MTHLNADAIRDRLRALDPLTGDLSLAGREVASVPALRLLAREIGVLSNDNPRGAADCLIELGECLYPQDRDAVLSIVGALVEAASTSDDPVIWAWVWDPAVNTWNPAEGKRNLVWALVNHQKAYARQCGLETLVTLVQNDERLFNDTLVREMIDRLGNDPIAQIRDVTKAWSQSMQKAPEGGPTGGRGTTPPS